VKRPWTQIREEVLSTGVDAKALAAELRKNATGETMVKVGRVAVRRRHGRSLMLEGYIHVVRVYTR
jgi:hypothetical protein